MPVESLRTPLIRLAENYPNAWVSKALRCIFRDRIEAREALRQIRERRNSIEAEKGILPESWPLIREDRER